ncbi:hypothetical protein CCR94_14950 [Rhodoblastus sphagnicola]|uniref:Antitoxin MazE n=1 Tax=Rhodoblastus sphagnicola TaxID=333368 RepID=A0A2S6N4S0_9HYPH|nr:antitoxin MazE family protein [Rhodoblastus sphagnicola]MBB4199615.1 hypothetical protein [Rhodoblastus sphagnicola]PPQ29621.1 hypothetical protein CCR94_14950 [Rhodoblastus sphagnicola]
MGKVTREPSRPRERMEAYRRRMRAAGLRPVQIWAPDTRSPEFAEISRRQSAVVAAAERDDAELRSFLDAARADLDRTAP